ncbi:hypothetical protein VPH35_082304 [Triticum aestivum]
MAGHLLPPLRPQGTLSHNSGHQPASPAGATTTVHCCPSPAFQIVPPLPVGSCRSSLPTTRSPSSPASHHLDGVATGRPRRRPQPRSCSQTSSSAASPSLPYALTTSILHAPTSPPA